VQAKTGRTTVKGGPQMQPNIFIIVWQLLHGLV
jgi:hypothetical protein